MTNAKKTRLERAAEAWEAAARARAGGPPPDLARLQQAVGDEMGRKLHELASQPPRRSLADEMEYLRLWAVYVAARECPLFEALSIFHVRHGLRHEEWIIQCDTVFPGHSHIGDRHHWVASWMLDRTVLRMPGDWVPFAVQEVKEWLRLIERNLANEIGAPA